MVTVHPTGFTRLGAVGDESTYRANIIFVHGLGGNSRGTWSGRADVPGENGSDIVAPSDKRASSIRATLRQLFRKKKPSASASGNDDAQPTPPGPPTPSTQETRKVFWPDELLTEDIKDARIWTYGYDVKLVAGFFEDHNHNNVSQHGKELANKLDAEITNEDPIIFVAHSLGGILVKDAIHRSRKCRNRTRLVVFLGTPHRGSSLARWGSKAAKVAPLTLRNSNKAVIQALEVRGEVLDNIHTNFVRIVEEHKIKIHSFQEGQKWKTIDEKVVDDISSVLDVPEYETVESIDADHRSMVKCSSRDDARYIAIYSVLSDAFVNGLTADVFDPGVLPVRSAMAIEIAKGSRARFRVPFNQNSRFTGREDVIESIRQKLFLTQNCTTMGILGLGGVGKSQVALQLAFWVKENEPDYSVYWMPAYSRESFDNACAELVRDIGLPCGNEEDHKEVLHRYLGSELSGKWLIILDNADDEEIIFGASEGPPGISTFIPQNEDGRLLFTTRTRKIAVEMAQQDFVLLKEMSPGESLNFIRGAVPADAISSEDEANELLELLCHIPLAISQAAAYIIAKHSTVGEYLELFRKTELDMSELFNAGFRDTTRYSESQNAVFKTWFVSFDQIEELDTIAYEILAFLPFIEPKAIPTSCLPKNGLTDAVLSGKVKDSADLDEYLELDGPGFEISEERLKQATELLCDYEMLYKREDGTTFDMHSLVHVALSAWVRSQEVWDLSYGAAIDYLRLLLLDNDWEHREIWRPILPHALALCRDTRSPTDDLVGLMVQVALCLKADGKLKAALQLLEKAKRGAAGVLEEDNIEMLYLTQALADLYSDVGRTEDSVALLQRSLTIVSLSSKGEGMVTPTMQRLLASAYYDNGEYQKSIDLYERAIKAIRLEADGTEDHDFDLVESQRGLAGAYFLGGRENEGMALLQSLMTEGHGGLAATHLQQLRVQTALARAYSIELDPEEAKKALPLMEQVVETYKKQSIESEEALGSQKTLAHIYIRLGKKADAAELLSFTVKAAESNLGAEHPLRLSVMTLLAETMTSMGFHEQAMRIFESAFVSYDRISDYTDLSFEKTGNMKNLAHEYTRSGKANMAIILLQFVRKAQKEIPGLGQGHVWDCLHELALAYQVNKQIKESIPLFEEVLEGAEESEDGRNFMRTDLAISYFQVGERQKAIDILEEVLKAQVDKVTMRNPVTMLTARYLVEFYEIYKGLKAEKPMLSRISHPLPFKRIAELEDTENPVHVKVENNLAYLRNLPASSVTNVQSKGLVNQDDQHIITEPLTQGIKMKL